MKKDRYIQRRNVTLQDGKKIQRLFNYFKRIKRKGELTITDFREFGAKSTETVQLFNKYYPQIKDKFINDANDELWMLWKSTLVSNMISKWEKLPDRHFVLMKDWSNKLITRINKYFEPVLVRNIKAQTATEDSEDILERGNKLTYRWAAGIVISNQIAYLLTRLMKKTTTVRQLRTDDIMTLYDKLKAKTRKKNLKAFLTRSYRRFEDADKTRNRCAHLNEGEPTKQEIEQSIALAKLLQKYL